MGNKILGDENFVYFNFKARFVFDPIEGFELNFTDHDGEFSTNIYGEGVRTEIYSGLVLFEAAGALKHAAKIFIPDEFNGIPVIGVYDNAFKHFDAAHIRLPKTLKFIGHYAFLGGRFEHIELPQGLIYLGDNCFAKSRLKTITIPSSVWTVASKCFFGCDQLAEVNFSGDELRLIGDYAFADCSSLTQANLPKSAIFIGSGAFRDTGIPEENRPAANEELISGYRKAYEEKHA